MKIFGGDRGGAALHHTGYEGPTSPMLCPWHIKEKTKGNRSLVLQGLWYASPWPLSPALKTVDMNSPSIEPCDRSGQQGPANDQGVVDMNVQCSNPEMHPQ